MRILIGTPAFGGMVHLGFVNSLMDFQRHGLPFSLASIGNESLITRARNSIVSYFYSRHEHYSHLLFLDADVHLPAAGLQKLLSFQRDVVAAPVPLKTLGGDGNTRHSFAGFGNKVANNLYETAEAATGVLLLSRDAVVALVEAAKAEGLAYNNWSGYDNSATLTEMTMYDVFRVGAVDGRYVSEDFWACGKLRELGFTIHVTDAVQVTHYGMHGFR